MPKQGLLQGVLPVFCTQLGPHPVNLDGFLHLVRPEYHALTGSFPELMQREHMKLLL